MRLDGKKLEIRFGEHRGFIFGGPFRNYEVGTRRLVGVKMAVEIDYPCEISIPTKDFSIPSVEKMDMGAIHAVRAIAYGRDIYAGCMGGVGRTGLFMGVMAKAMFDFNKVKNVDPVIFVREVYKPHAIETSEQQAFVRGYDTSNIVREMERLNYPRVNITGWRGLILRFLKVI